MTRDTITIELRSEGDFVDASTYHTALSKLLAVLREVDGVLTHRAGASGRSVKWLIRSTHTSNPTIVIQAESTKEEVDVGRIVIGSTLTALDSLQREPTRPNDLTYAAIERCQELSDLVRRDGLREIVVGADSREAIVTGRLAENVRELVGQKSEVLGSVEGVLEMITLRGRGYFNVYSDVTGKATKCYFDSEMIDTAKDALGRRVIVTGLIRSFPLEEGQEMARINSVEILPSDDDLPTPDEVMGLIPDLTGGKPSEQYLKERWLGQPQT